MGSCSEEVVKFKKILMKEFELTGLGKLVYILRMEVLYSEKGIILHQLKYELELLKRFKLQNCKAAVTPSDTNHKLDSDSEGEDVNATTFKQLVGSLRYIKGTLKFGVLFPCGGMTDSELMSYFGSDWWGDRVDRRSTSGYLFKFLGGHISWYFKKQHVVALSTCEAEYIAGVVAACQVVWLLNLL
ncbi:secreted RxLR effector protein 161-like [Vicia villosa]|uniref:secreted RxLR effector protein 161-like n=1 Tax=Vicia villosa TaxID=3911 RepID=UPI00273AE501|nr:secreted RxLR effector protein 161-like [Vicia villosa]